MGVEWDAAERCLVSRWCAVTAWTTTIRRAHRVLLHLQDPVETRLAVGGAARSVRRGQSWRRESTSPSSPEAGADATSISRVPLMHS